MKKDEYAFIALLEYAKDGVNVSFPDLPGCRARARAGATAAAVRNAREALELHLFGMERGGERIPKPTPLNRLMLKRNCAPVVVSAFMPSVRAAAKTAFVKKTLSLPAWLSALADERSVNCSKIFQDALKSFLGVSEPSLAELGARTEGRGS